MNMKRQYRIKVDGQPVTGTVQWNNQRAQLTATVQCPYRGRSFQGSPRVGTREPKLFTPSGDWTDFLIDYGTKLLNFAYKAARKQSDPRFYPDDTTLRNTWPNLGNAAANSEWLGRFMSAGRVAEAEGLPPNGRVLANNTGVSIVDTQDGSCHLMFSYDIESLIGFQAAVNFHHWRRFSSQYTQGIAGRLFFDVVLERVGVACTGPWRQSKIRFWWNRVHEARQRGIHLFAYNPDDNSIGDPTKFLDFQPNEEDSWDSEMDYPEFQMVFSQMLLA
jgi:hypothetical protein